MPSIEPSIATPDILRAVIDGLADAVLVLGRDRELLIVNPAARALFGEALGTRLEPHWPEQLCAYTSDGSRLLAPTEGPLADTLEGEPIEDFRLLLRAAHHAESRAMSATRRPLPDANGTIVATVVTFRDLTEAQRAERARRQSETRFRRLSEATFEGIALSVDGILLDSNDTFARMFGYEPEEVLGRDTTDLIAASSRPIVSAHVAAQSEDTYEATGLRKDGSELALELRDRMVEIDGIRLRITALRDITERKRTEATLATQAEALRTMAIRDELTGLYNRRGFHELGEPQLRLADRADRTTALIFADVNGLKRINDELGHDQGDQVIRDAASVLRGVTRSADLVARLGGDEFVVLASGLCPENLPVFAGRLTAAITHHNTTAKRPFALSISVGVAYRSPRSARTLDALLAEADQLMYEQKRASHLERGRG